MVNDIDDDFAEELYSTQEPSESTDTNIGSSTLANKIAQEQAQKNLLARKRIDELMEKKRLKELLDDSEDW
ncbi:PA3496 family putative envelope integrity protein [Colwellia sp. RSH04]|uniref:PA3496 family putative envelope integrity protein n=1 Tax=Colwellia sp. RSH04 TaxID=2305464 RepID=UPI000E58482B|nr:hypothetical protein [Colwellia sp. RSH04]RHW77511.1 hypothetical protein D1094_00710 [Colwellia sp. RSH04]